MFTFYLWEYWYYFMRIKVGQIRKHTLKKHKGNVLAVIILASIGILLSVEAGYFLYNPDRFTTSSPFAVLEIIRGSVLVLEKDAVTWERAKNGMTLESGSRIKTSSDTDAVITFTRGTTTKLEPGTDLIIDQIQEGQGSQPYAILLKQQSGKTWNQVDKADGKASFKINTLSADIVVHGTLFSAEVDETGKTTVQTTEGKVGVSAGGSEVQVPAGKMTEVKPNEKPSAPAAIPQARNELVITVNQPALGLVKNPDGASIGYLKSGAKINQITDSSVSAIGETSQTIRIREPEAGEYTLTLRGITDGTGQVTVQGLIGGESAFLSIESCNITAAKDTLLKLHYNVIDGLLMRADDSSKMALASTLEETPVAAKSSNIQPAPTASGKTTPALSKKEASSGQGFSWFGLDRYGNMTRWVSVSSFLFLMGVIFIVMRRKS
jgi:hypothetical protein